VAVHLLLHSAERLSLCPFEELNPKRVNARNRRFRGASAREECTVGNSVQLRHSARALVGRLVREYSRDYPATSSLCSGVGAASL